MKSLDYVITEPVGILACPAGLLNKEARKYKSAITIHSGAKSANVLRLMAVMQLGVKCGETVKVTIEGEDEGPSLPSLKSSSRPISKL